MRKQKGKGKERQTDVSSSLRSSYRRAGAGGSHILGQWGNLARHFLTVKSGARVEGEFSSRALA